ncbi:hypothetical protein MMC22_009922 [Lobaria immixta]|nr:hypothetical protein [Lobaria immixta]
MATPEVLPVPADITRRDYWAQWQTRKGLAKLYNDTPASSLPENTKPLLPPLPTSGPKIEPGDLPKLPEFHPSEPVKSLPHEIKVCIVGAGAAGLFTAMIFDWLKEKSKERTIPELNISYDIHEAAEKDRLGGRLYTHKFPLEHPSDPHQYYDVGAMRFPDNPIMKRTFDLFEYLGIHKRSSEHPDGKLIPYYLEGKNNPTYFNDIYYPDPPKPPREGKFDPYKMNPDPPSGAPIPDQDGPEETLNKAIKVYRDAFACNPEKGWRMLMDADKFTARDFLQLPPLREFETVNTVTAFVPSKDKEDRNKDENPIGGPGFNFNTVEWLETFNGGTHGYSQAFSEMVLGSLDFDYPSTKKIDWYCIDGGANVLAQEMAKRISQKPNFCSAITSIKLENKEEIHSIKVGIERQEEGLYHKNYAAVFNSTTLGAMQRMDLTGAQLNLGTKQAIRTLNYGASCKVGIRFCKPWWILAPHHIDGGGQGKSDLPLRVCVYPSYNIEDDPSKPSVLLCSYTWEQDASRIGALISKNSPEGEKMLKKLLFHNLALLHSTSATYEKVYKTIEDSYITHHAYDWYKDPHSVGAFAFFGPSQFQEVWPDITCPSADGKLIIIGEAASTHHAWVVGALESAMRGVYQFIARYALIYPEYKKALEYLESLQLKPEDTPHDPTYKPTPDPDIRYQRPFGPLPYSFQPKIAQHQVVVSMLRAEGSIK